VQILRDFYQGFTWRLFFKWSAFSFFVSWITSFSLQIRYHFAISESLLSFLIAVPVTVLACTGLILHTRRLARRESGLVAPIRSPGDSLRRLAQLCFSKKTCSRVFEPTLSDLWTEYIEALGANDLWRARLVLLRGYGSFWATFAAQLPVSVLRVVVELWKATRIG
jgi:hypothetical protein